MFDRRKIIDKIKNFFKDRDRRNIFFVLLVAFLLRLLMVLVLYNKDPSLLINKGGDVTGFLELARGLGENGKFSRISSPDIPELFRMPGYPIFLWLVFLLFNGSILTMSVVQTIISTISVLVLYLTIKQIWNKKIALIGALILSFEFSVVYYSAILLTETLFFFFFALFLYFCVRFFQERTKQMAFLTGLFLVIATFTRPVTLYLIFPIIILVGFILFRQKMDYKKIAKLIILLFIPWLLLTQAWNLRNLIVSGSYFFNNTAGYTLFAHKAQDILAYKKGLPTFVFMQDNPMNKDFPENFDSLSLEQRNNIYLQRATPIILNNLGAYFITSLRGFVLTMLLPGEPLFNHASIVNANLKNHIEYYTLGNVFLYSSNYPERFIVSAIYFIFLIILYLLTIYGWCKSYIQACKQERYVHILLLGIIFYFSLINFAVVYGGAARYRMPVILVCVIYGAKGILELLSGFKDKRLS